MRTESARYNLLPRVSQKFPILGILFSGIALFAGCGSKPTVPGAHLAGIVTVDGQPIQKGSISFVPMEGTRGKATGAHIVDGRYDCPYVPLGNILMQVNATRLTGSGKMIEAMGTKMPEMEDIFFVKEDAVIKIEVRQDNLDLDFKLRSTKPKK